MAWVGWQLFPGGWQLLPSPWNGVQCQDLIEVGEAYVEGLWDVKSWALPSHSPGAIVPGSDHQEIVVESDCRGQDVPAFDIGPLSGNWGEWEEDPWEKKWPSQMQEISFARRISIMCGHASCR